MRRPASTLRVPLRYPDEWPLEPEHMTEAKLSCERRAYLAGQLDVDAFELRVEATLAGLDVLVPLETSSPFRPPADDLEAVYV